MGVEHKVTETIVLADIRGDGDGALVYKLATKLEIVERDGVVSGLDPVVVMLAFNDEMPYLRFNGAPQEHPPSWEDISV
jgi:hypothetical protein